MSFRVSKRSLHLCIMGFVTILFAGCASTPAPVDPRSDEERASAFDVAAKELVGTYTVIETRHEFFNGRNLKVKEVVVTRSANTLDYLLKGERDKPLFMAAKKCRTFYPVKPNQIFCENTGTEMWGPTFSKESAARQVNLGGLIEIQGPLKLEPGEFLLYFSELGPGRLHYYRLKKN